MKNNIKKYLSLLLVLALILTALPMAALAEEMEEDLNDEEEIVYPEELIVGHPTITKGDFFTEMFGNDTADIDVRALIHGYNLVNWDQNQGVYVLDPTVVVDVEVVEDEVGNRTYYLVLADDLFYSDGTPITAWDYAFSLLLMMAPEIEEIGGKIYRAQHILGYKEYITKEYDTLGGVMVLSDHQLAITLDHEFLPYFFETGLLLCVPYPIHVIAPGCKVYDDGYGCYIGNEDQNIEEPIFTADLLRKTILDPETGYNSHPSVVSGPYMLTSYDYETAHFEINPYFKGAWVNNTLPEDFHFDLENLSGAGSGTMAHHNANLDRYIKVDRLDKDGNEDPFYMIQPSIEKIAFTVADNDTIAEDLSEGRLHLVNKVVYGPAIMECMGTTAVDAEDDEFDPDAFSEEEPEEAEQEESEEEPEEEELDISGIRYQNYPRIGLAFLTFTYDWPTVHEQDVRQAIAWCMDRDALTRAYTPYGMVVNGYYGIEQWEYLLVTHQIEFPINFLDDEEHDQEDYQKFKNRYVKTDKEYEEALAAWEMYSLDNLTNYNVYDLENDPDRTEKIGIDKANALLDSAKWTLNREGETYRPGIDDVRCKMVDDELVALDLTMMYPEGNHIVDTIQENFIDNLNACGIQLTLVPTPMQDLFKSYYRETERTTDMIYLATNFHVIVDPSITYSTDDSVGHQIWNNTYSDDEDLYYRAVDMRRTDPGDIYDYVGKWIAFQERYNEVLPTIPIYSNVYFDFYTSQLQNYHITAHVTWTQAILEAYWGEEEEADDMDDFWDDDDDSMMFDE